jgi:hypothetical protein
VIKVMKVATDSTAGRKARIASKDPTRRNGEVDIGETFLRRNNGTAVGLLVPNSHVIVFAPGRNHKGKTSKFPKVPRLRSGRGNWKEVSSTFASKEPTRRNGEVEIVETSLPRCNGTTVGLDSHNVQVIEFTPGRNHKDKTRGISKSSKLMVRPRQEETKGIRPRH